MRKVIFFSLLRRKVIWMEKRLLPKAKCSLPFGDVLPWELDMSALIKTQKSSWGPTEILLSAYCQAHIKIVQGKLQVKIESTGTAPVLGANK